MKYLLINSLCGIRSTGKICADLATTLSKEGHEVKIAYGRGDVPEKYKSYSVKIGTEIDTKLHAVQTRIFDTHGFASKKTTLNFLKWADRFDPDVLWLHNLHGYYINVEILFVWIKSRPQMKVNWTLHDCWSFTGHCSHFLVAKCEQWKNHCQKCVQKKAYPSSYFIDNCKKNFERKKIAFTNVNNMKLITPSQWLANLVKQSYLKEYAVEVHYNTIDQSVFKPTPSNFREKYGLQKKIVILGVASNWNERKGLYDFEKLSTMLDDRYTVVLVGLTKKQINRISNNIIAIEHTNNAQELAEIYSAADIFFNPTYEDTYPTVNLEAEACGIPVITYKTGGAPETLKDFRSTVVEVGCISDVLQVIQSGLYISSYKQ